MYNTAFDDVDINNLTSPSPLNLDDDFNHSAYVSLSSSHQSISSHQHSNNSGLSDNYAEDDLLVSQTTRLPLWKRCLQSCSSILFPPHQLVERSITYHGNSPYKDYASYKTHRHEIVHSNRSLFAPNVVKNTKYTPFTFIFVFLYNEFRFFFNLYFLLVALSQFIPLLQVGFLFTYIAPLCFVLLVSMTKEIYDDIKRFLRDAAANSSVYQLYIPRTDNTPPGRNRFPMADASYHDPSQVESIDSLPTTPVKSSDLLPGDIIVLHPQQRVPCDCVLLKAYDKSGTVFIKTDQLDGETDWKLRIPPKLTQNRCWARWDSREGSITVNAEAPKLNIYDFKGNIECARGQSSPTNDMTSISPSIEPLSLDNTIWGNTTVASCSLLAMVVYTGKDSRSSLNANQPRTKTGALDLEVNYLSKILFVLTLLLAVVMTILKGFQGLWFVYLFRYLLLFSSIIPISLRVNLDMAKLWYSYSINSDKDIPDTTVRTSTIPEELGRISYIFSDKTGTLTTNTMAFKVLQLAPPLSFTADTIDALRYHIDKAFPSSNSHIGAPIGDLASRRAFLPPHGGRHIAAHFAAKQAQTENGMPSERSIFNFTLDNSHQQGEQRSSPPGSNAAIPSIAMDPSPTEPSLYPIGGLPSDLIQSQIRQLMQAIVLCHNVTPAEESGANGDGGQRDEPSTTASSGIGRDTSSSQLLSTSSSSNRDDDDDDDDDGDSGQHATTYQASSPDEVALVTFASSVGLSLVHRDTATMSYRTPSGNTITVEILAIFPFTSATKRMGIIVRDPDTHTITYYLKGAESVIVPKCKPNPWVMEEVSNLARVGLRTLVYASRELSQHQFSVFNEELQSAQASLEGRDLRIARAVESIEVDMDCIGITGVEDKLQDNIRGTLETLRNAGIKIWMLTGDKNETAACIGLSTRLVDRGQRIVELSCSDRREAALSLDHASKFNNACLLVDGPSLQVLLDNFPIEFLEIACVCPAVICCRCSPTQKAQVVTHMKEYTGKRTLAIGDGGNDVSMIQAAHVGVGIVGKEGNQAAMSSDFSINQFQYITHLLLWHGRNSYKRSASLAQFVMHRGMIISIIQAVFCSLYFFVAVPVYNGWLMVGYTTLYTMFPVFSLVLDTDITKHAAFMYPELYQALQLGKPLSLKTFFVWVLLSVYQGALIMILGIVLFEQSFINIVSITFSALILSELLNVVISIKHWSMLMVYAQLLSVVSYLVSMVVLKSYFDITFITSFEFIYKVAIIITASAIPPALVVFFLRRCKPSDHSKVSQSYESSDLL